MKRIALIVSSMLIIGCATQQDQSRAAAIYYAGVRAAKRVCSVIDRLPDPPASSGSEGDAGVP